ncbi:MAG: amino acid permease [Bacteroidota bacterium]
MEKGKIGLWESTSLVLGNMIGSGIFLLPASLAFYGGISLGGWIVASLGALLLAKVFSKLSKVYPKTGGPYVYAREGMGDFAGFLVAWGYWISVCVTNAAIAVAMLSYMTVFLPVLGESPILSIALGLSVIWGLSFLNMQGVKGAGKLQLITTILKVAPLMLIAIVGLFYMDWSHFTPFNLSDKSALQAITETATLTLFAFLGIECASIPADNIKDPEKTIPAATQWGTYIAIAVYILSSMVLLGVLSPTELQNSEAPFADAAAFMWGESARFIVAIAAIISTFGALNGWILIQGQIPLAVARDKMFHQAFGKTNSKGSPAVGITISSIFISVIMILNFSKGFVKAFEFMILLGTLTVLIPYLFSSATHILISYEKSKPWSWLLGLLAFIFSLWAVIGSGEEVVFWGFVLLMAGIPIYIFIKLKQREESKD